MNIFVGKKQTTTYNSFTFSICNSTFPKSIDKDTEEITVAKVGEKKNLEEKIEMYV
jgi:hypothetical protein